MFEKEKKIINNVANKVQIILDRNKIKVLTLAKLLKLDKQPLYRIMKREHIPNLPYLGVIADYLNCTIVELIDEKFFLDIDVHNDYNINNKHEKYRVYIHDEKLPDIVANEFFGIMENSFIKVFYKVDLVLNDGLYLIYDDKKALKEINIIGVGTNLILALINNKEVRFKPEEIKVFAKLYTTVSVIQSKGCAVKY